MLQHGYEYMPYVSQEKLIEDNKPEYYIALRASQKTLRTKKEDISAWLTFFLKIILEQSEKAINTISHEEVSKLLSPQQDIVWEYITKQAGVVTPLEISQATNIPRPTINQVLNKLLQLKWIERIGQGRTTRYRKR